MNYFELFDIPVSIKIDKTTLAKKYFELQKKYHPDFFAQGTEAEQSEALEQSSAANKALKILKNEDETIKYILQLKGLLEEEEKYKLPPEFLMEMMDLNEELSDDSPQKVAALETQLYSEIALIIENYNDATISNTELLQLKEYYYKKKYLHRILDRIGDWRNIAALPIAIGINNAQMAELVYATDSKSVVRKDVQVRFLFWALRKSFADRGAFLFYCHSDTFTNDHNIRLKVMYI